MSRALLLLLVASCGGSQTTSQRPSSTPATLQARITRDGDGSWVDIAASGAPEHARAFCDQLVARELQIEGRVARACAPAALPPIPRTAGALLVETDRPSSDRPQATAEVATYHPYADRTACDRARAQLVANDTQRREDAERARVLELERRIRDATDARDRACGAVAEEDARCATRKGDERTQCNLAVEPKRMACRDATRRRDELDRPAAPLPPLPERGCVGTV